MGDDAGVPLIRPRARPRPPSVSALRVAYGGCAPTCACGRSPKGEGFLFYKLFINFTLAERCPGGSLLGGGGGGQAACLQGAGGGYGLLQRGGGGIGHGGGVGTGQHQHILTAGVVFLIVGNGLAQRGLFDLLVQLGQLTAEGYRAVRAERGGKIIKGAAQLVRCP